VKNVSRLCTAAAAVLSIVFAQGVASADEAQLYAAAKKEGSLTWYISQYSGETAEKIGRNFSRKYPGVSVNVVRATNTVTYQRILQDLQVQAQQCDVLGTTEIGNFEALKKRGALLQYVPSNAKDISPKLAIQGSDGYYHTTSAGLIGIGYNSGKVAADAKPKVWKDLLDKKFKGQVALGHPAFSGYVAIWVEAVKELYGWTYFQALKANEPLVGRSIQDVLTNLVSGERIVGAASLPEFLASKRKGNPVDVVFPTDGTVLLVNPTGILKNAAHPNAAKLFVEYLMSVDNNQMLAKDYQPSIRDDVSPEPGMPKLSDIKLLRANDAALVKNLQEVRREWKATFR
jgi:iron(III) transport system substrate-binding protein